MFIKGNKESEKDRLPKVPCPPSLLSMDFDVTGDIRSDGEVQIDGNVNGNIVAHQLIIGETAQIPKLISKLNQEMHLLQ